MSYLYESFNYFKTLAPNRVTVSQAIAYTKYRLYFEDAVIADHKVIEKYLESKKQDCFIYKYQKQFGDGYIQKRKNNEI